MASLFFRDYFFPSELYDQDTGHFTTPVRTLVDFAPHILQELPKKEPKPIKSTQEDSWTKQFMKPKNLFTSETTKAITEFVVRCGNEYLRQTSEGKRREEKSSNKEKKTKEQKAKEQKAREQNKNKDEKKSKSDDDEEHKEVARTDNILAKSAAAAGLLSFAFYSTYQAGVVFSDISFHNQLEILLSQVQSIIQSTDVWIKEHEKLGDKVPNQVVSDLSYLRDIVNLIERLDPRSHKKLEAAGWGFGAIGGLSSLGGFLLGSAAVATGGAALAVGGTIVMLTSKAQMAGKNSLGTRLLLESQVREKLSELNKDSEKRKKIVKVGFNKERPVSAKSACTKKEPLIAKTELPIKDEPVKTSKRKEKVALTSK